MSSGDDVEEEQAPSPVVAPRRKADRKRSKNAFVDDEAEEGEDDDAKARESVSDDDEDDESGGNVSDLVDDEEDTSSASESREEVDIDFMTDGVYAGLGASVPVHILRRRTVGAAMLQVLDTTKHSSLDVTVKHDRRLKLESTDDVAAQRRLMVYAEPGGVKASYIDSYNRDMSICVTGDIDSGVAHLKVPHMNDSKPAMDVRALAFQFDSDRFQLVEVNLLMGRFCAFQYLLRTILHDLHVVDSSLVEEVPVCVTWAINFDVHHMILLSQTDQIKEDTQHSPNLFNRILTKMLHGIRPDPHTLATGMSKKAYTNLINAVFVYKGERFDTHVRNIYAWLEMMKKETDRVKGLQGLDTMPNDSDDIHRIHVSSSIMACLMVWLVKHVGTDYPGAKVASVATSSDNLVVCIPAGREAKVAFCTYVCQVVRRFELIFHAFKLKLHDNKVVVVPVPRIPMPRFEDGDVDQPQSFLVEVKTLCILVGDTSAPCSDFPGLNVQPRHYVRSPDRDDEEDEEDDEDESRPMRQATLFDMQPTAQRTNTKRRKVLSSSDDADSDNNINQSAAMVIAADDDSDGGLVGSQPPHEENTSGSRGHSPSLFSGQTDDGPTLNPPPPHDIDLFNDEDGMDEHAPPPPTDVDPIHGQSYVEFITNMPDAVLDSYIETVFRPWVTSAKGIFIDAYNQTANWELPFLVCSPRDAHHHNDLLHTFLMLLLDKFLATGLGQWCPEDCDAPDTIHDVHLDLEGGTFYPRRLHMPPTTDERASSERVGLKMYLPMAMNLYAYDIARTTTHFNGVTLQIVLDQFWCLLKRAKCVRSRDSVASALDQAVGVVMGEDVDAEAESQPSVDTNADSIVCLPSQVLYNAPSVKDGFRRFALGNSVGDGAIANRLVCDGYGLHTLPPVQRFTFAVQKHIVTLSNNMGLTASRLQLARSLKGSRASRFFDIKATDMETFLVDLRRLRNHTLHLPTPVDPDLDIGEVSHDTSVWIRDETFCASFVDPWINLLLKYCPKTLSLVMTQMAVETLDDDTVFFPTADNLKERTMEEKALVLLSLAHLCSVFTQYQDESRRIVSMNGIGGTFKSTFLHMFTSAFGPNGTLLTHADEDVHTFRDFFEDERQYVHGLSEAVMFVSEDRKNDYGAKCPLPLRNKFFGNSTDIDVLAQNKYKLAKKVNVLKGLGMLDQGNLPAMEPYERYRNNEITAEEAMLQSVNGSTEKGTSSLRRAVLLAPWNNLCDPSLVKTKRQYLGSHTDLKNDDHNTLFTVLIGVALERIRLHFKMTSSDVPLYTRLMVNLVEMTVEETRKQLLAVIEPTDEQVEFHHDNKKLTIFHSVPIYNIWKPDGEGKFSPKDVTMAMNNGKKIRHMACSLCGLTITGLRQTTMSELLSAPPPQTMFDVLCTEVCPMSDDAGGTHVWKYVWLTVSGWRFLQDSTSLHVRFQ